MSTTRPERIASYNRLTGHPGGLFVAEDGRVVGTWITGNDYRVTSGYYGGYSRWLSQAGAGAVYRQNARVAPVQRRK